MDRGAWQAVVYGVTKELDMTWQLNSNTGSYVTFIYRHRMEVKPRPEQHRSQHSRRPVRLRRKNG